MGGTMWSASACHLNAVESHGHVLKALPSASGAGLLLLQAPPLRDGPLVLTPCSVPFTWHPAPAPTSPTCPQHRLKFHLPTQGVQ